MKIALLGYGKMGKTIENILIERGHTVHCKITSQNANKSNELLPGADVIIEFSIPSAVIDNIRLCFGLNIPVVVGTTGWNDQIAEIETQCLNTNNTLFHASNFSIGMNLFMETNRKLAALMSNWDDYDVSMREIHHIHKLDAPSGTAITLAEQIDENHCGVSSWKLKGEEGIGLPIEAVREGEVPGTHIINYENQIDRIEIMHEAKNRKGFALGSVLAAEFIANKKGVYNMRNLLQLD